MSFNNKFEFNHYLQSVQALLNAQKQRMANENFKKACETFDDKSTAHV